MTGTLSNIFFFNPTCEYAVANGNSSWQANKILQKMEHDMATLPMFFAQSQDIVLVNQIPSDDFKSQFESINFPLPSFTLKEKILHSKSSEKNYNKLLPWGWSPAAHKLLTPLKIKCSENFINSPVAHWKPEHKEIYSKGFALQIAKELHRKFPSDKFITEELIAETATRQEQIERLLLRWGQVMTKAPWSSSGRGLQPITKTPVHPKVWEKILGIIKEQGYAIVEPYLEKAADLAFQFEIQKGKIHFLGLSHFSTDKKGQYQGNFLNGLPSTYSAEVKSFVLEQSESLVIPLISVLERSKFAQLYEGNFGVDTLIFRDKNGQLKINPCLEINVRQNMGLLSLHLEKLIYQSKAGLYRTYFYPGKTFLSFKKEMEKQYPLQINSRKIESGFFPLTDATHDAQFGAYILI